jgi:hypothetical protein
MLMSPATRRWALMLHVACSVGWAGSVAVFLALALVGLDSVDRTVVSASYVASDLITRLVIVPLCFAALATGLTQSLGTTWGLFRHYWVIAKLVLQLLGTGLLLLHTEAIRHVAAVASSEALASGDYRRLRIQLVGDAAGALALLLAATWLSVFKPRGITPYGWRKERNRTAEACD